MRVRDVAAQDAGIPPLRRHLFWFRTFLPGYRPPVLLCKIGRTLEQMLKLTSGVLRALVAAVSASTARALRKWVSVAPVVIYDYK